MANEEDISLDDMDFDDFGFGDDMDFSSEVKDDRKPVVKAASGFLDGVKETATDGGFIRRTVSDALPEGYRKGIYAADDLASTAGSLYDSAAKELAPAVKEMKTVGRRLLPKVEKALPNKLSAKLKDLVKDEEQDRAISVEEAREKSTALMLGNIFSEQATADHEEKVRNELKDLLKESSDDKRFQHNSRQQQYIAEKMASLVGYQDRVTAKYQQKSLEIQYRQLFIQTDNLNYFKAYAKETKDALEGIRYNTSLPEHVKVQMGEIADLALKERIVGHIQGKAGDYVSSFSGNLAKTLKTKLSEKASAFRDDLAAASASLDMAESMEDMPGVDKTEMGGSIAGGVATEFGGGWLSKFLAEKLAKNKKIMEIGELVGYGAENMQGLAMDVLSGPEQDVDYDSEGNERSFLEKNAIRALNVFRELAPAQFNEGSTLKEDDLLIKGQEAVAFNRLASQSITEVIPGHLSRIHHELVKTRTGNDEAPRTVYNLERQQFTTEEEATKDAARRILSKRDEEVISSHTEKAINTIDSDEELSKEARKLLGKLIVRDARKGMPFTRERYADASSMGGAGSPEQKEEIASLIKKKFYNTDGSKKLSASKDLRSAATDVRSLANSMPKVSEDVVRYMMAGGRDSIDNLGLLERNLDGTHTVQTDSIWDALNESLYKGSTKDDEANKDYWESPLRYNLPTNSPSSAIPADSSKMDDSPSIERERVSGYQEDYGRPLVDQLMRINDRLWGETNGSSRNPEEMMVSQAFLQSQFDRIQTGGVEEGNPLLDQAEMTNSLLGNILAMLPSLGSGGGGMAPNDRKSLLDGIKTGGKAGAKSIFRLYGKFLDGFGDLGKGALSGAGALASKLGGRFSKKKEEFTDIYVRGKAYPSLLLDKLKNGEYRDKLTGKVITSIDDIKGEVIDADDNIVLSKDDFKAGLVNARGKASAGLKKLGSKILGAYGALLTPIPTAIGFVTKGMGQLKDFLLDYTDVYVKGESRPRLLANVLKNGGYFNTDGSVIKKLKDISGDVLDKNGNVVLSLEDYRNGLVDPSGRAIKSVNTRLGSLLGRAKDMGKAVAGAYAKGIGKLAKLGGSIVGRVTGKITGGEKTQVSDPDTVSWLERIYDLLGERLPKPKARKLGDLDGDGIREGSYRDLLSKDKGETDEGVKGTVKEKFKAKAGPLAMMLQAAKNRLMGGGGDDDGDTYVDLGDGPDRDGKDKKGKKPKGKGGKKGLFRRAAGSVGGLLKRGAGMAGTAAKFIGRQVLWQGGRMLLGAAAATLSAPVLLGAAAVAGVAGLGYLAYKKFSKGPKLDEFDNIRMAYYGINVKDEESLNKVRFLESKMSEGASVNINTGKVQFKFDSKEIIEGVGVNEDTPANDRAQFVQWFTTVFKPLLAANMLSLKKVKQSTDSVTGKYSKVDKTVRFKFVKDFIDNSQAIPDGLEFSGGVISLSVPRSSAKAMARKLLDRLGLVKATDKSTGAVAPVAAVVEADKDKVKSDDGAKAPEELKGSQKELKTMDKAVDDLRTRKKIETITAGQNAQTANDNMLAGVASIDSVLKQSLEVQKNTSESMMSVLKILEIVHEDEIKDAEGSGLFDFFSKKKKKTGTEAVPGKRSSNVRNVGGDKISVSG